MRRLDSIKAKLAAMEKLVGEIRKELEKLEDVSPQNRRETRASPAPVPLETDLQAEYERLFERVLVEGLGPIQEFVNAKSKAYLKFFCRANNLGVDTTKASKAAIVEALSKRMAESRAIRQKVVSS